MRCAFRPFLKDIDGRAVGNEGGDDAFRLHGGIAEELRGAEVLAKAEPDRLGRRLAGAGPGRAGIRLLARHGFLEGIGVDSNTARAKGVFRQVEREAEGVVEFEGGAAVEGRALAHLGRCLFQEAEAARQGPAEAGLFQLQGFRHQRLGAGEFREGPAHLAHQRRHQPVEQRIARTEEMGVAHGPAHDPAQDVAAAFIRRKDAIGDQEAGGAQMVGNHPVAGEVLTGRPQRPSRPPRRRSAP